MPLARGDLVDRQRLWMAFELFDTTSLSVPILASLIVAPRQHVLHGETMWTRAIALADDLRARLAKIEGLRLFSTADVPARSDLDPISLLIDVSRPGVSGYAMGDWPNGHYRVSVGLSDMRHMLAIIAPGTHDADIRALARARCRWVPLGGGADPRVDVGMAMDAGAATFGRVEQVALEQAGGRIAAE